MAAHTLRPTSTPSCAGRVGVAGAICGASFIATVAAVQLQTELQRLASLQFGLQRALEPPRLCRRHRDAFERDGVDVDREGSHGGRNVVAGARILRKARTARLTVRPPIAEEPAAPQIRFVFKSMSALVRP